jgi:hypothetical protein
MLGAHGDVARTSQLREHDAFPPAFPPAFPRSSSGPFLPSPPPHPFSAGISAVFPVAYLGRIIGGLLAAGQRPTAGVPHVITRSRGSSSREARRRSGARSRGLGTSAVARQGRGGGRAARPHSTARAEENHQLTGPGLGSERSRARLGPAVVAEGGWAGEGDLSRHVQRVRAKIQPSWQQRVRSLLIFLPTSLPPSRRLVRRCQVYCDVPRPSLAPSRSLSRPPCLSTSFTVASLPLFPTLARSPRASRSRSFIFEPFHASLLPPARAEHSNFLLRWPPQAE